MAAGGAIESIQVTYPRGRISVAGFDLPWVMPFAAACLAFALLLRRPLGVVL
jgi:hypothetical protein